MNSQMESRRERRNARTQEYQGAGLLRATLCSSCLPVFLLSCLLFLLASGCHESTAPYDPALEAQIREKIDEIKPLELEPTDPNKAAPEPNVPPEKVELSLEQCRALALENNLQLKASLISPDHCGGATQRRRGGVRMVVLRECQLVQVGPAPGEGGSGGRYVLFPPSARPRSSTLRWTRAFECLCEPAAP